MWIDRLDFIGFGNLAGQCIEFAKGKVSVVVQPNEYGKSTMSEAIWAILYGFAEGEPLSGRTPGWERKPHSGAAFKAAMNLEIASRELRLIRSFGERSLKVLDLSKDLGKADADVTCEFADLIALDAIGASFTGLDRQLFKRTCMLGQRQLDRSPFTGDRNLSSMLLNIADSAGAATNVYDAIAYIEDLLNEFPFRGKTQALSHWLQSLVDERAALIENLGRIESERESRIQDMERLAELELHLQAKAKDLAANEYFQLCLEAAELDNRITHAQERRQRVEELQARTAALAHYANFPIAMQKTVDELWLRRQARLSDYKRLESEIKNNNIQSQIADLERNEVSEGLQEFKVEDAQILSGLGHALHQSLSELKNLKERQQFERQRIQAIGVDLHSIGVVRNSLLSLEPKELDDAHAFYSMVVAKRDRAEECERNAERARTVLKEINEQRYRISSAIDRVFWPSLCGAVIMLLPLAYLFVLQHQQMTDAASSVTTMFYVVGCLLAGLSYFGSKQVQTKYRVQDEQHAIAEEQAEIAEAQQQLEVMESIETQIERLARKAGLNTARDLVRNIQEYAISAAQLKDLDLLDNMISSELKQVEKLKREIASYFKRANRHVDEITPEETHKLTQAIHQTLDYKWRARQELFDHRESELQFLSDDIKDTDRSLRDLFQKVGLAGTSIEESFEQFSAAVTAYRTWESLNAEIERLEQDSAPDMKPSELERVTERLESKKADLWGRIQQIIVANPEIAALQPKLLETSISSIGKEMADSRQAIEEIRRERDELTVAVRAALRNYQDNVLQLKEQMELVDLDITKLQKAQASLLLARDTFAKLAQETHSVWADRLSDISREMLKHLGTEYESIEFEADLSIRVRRRGQREFINEWHIEHQLSTGTREQLHWLARTAIVRFLSHSKRLPLILDEPFSEFDDDRFLKIMRFLINTIGKTNQVIIFTCHQHRHEWLLERLEADERDCVELCRLVPLTSDSSAFVRR